MRFKIIEAKNELGGAKRGASLGVDALKLADAASGNNFFCEHASIASQNFNEALLYPQQFPKARYIDLIVKACNSLANTVTQTLHEGYFPVILSADHSNAAGTIAGIKDFFTDKRVGVLWVDAHADLHSPYTTPSGNMHGMPLAASLGINNLDQREIDNGRPETEHWEQMKHLGNSRIFPKILPEDLVYIGLRDTEKEERDFIRNFKIKTFEPDDIANLKIEEVARQSLAYLSACDVLYVSFDVDSLDPTVISGTGTPSPNGLGLYEAKQLLEILFDDDRLCAFEMSEINPLLDTKNQTAEVGLEILKFLI